MMASALWERFWTGSQVHKKQRESFWIGSQVHKNSLRPPAHVPAQVSLFLESHYHFLSTRQATCKGENLVADALPRCLLQRSPLSNMDLASLELLALARCTA